MRRRNMLGRLYTGLSLLGIVILLSFSIQSFDSVGALQTQGRARPETYDDRLAKIGRDIPGFGGMYVNDKTRTLYVLMTHFSPQFLAPQSLARVRQTIVARILDKELAGYRVEVLQANYSFLDLKEWYDRARPEIFKVKGITSTDIDEKRNRLRIGVQNQAALREVRGVIAAQGVPAEAVSIELERPIRFASSLTTRHRPLVGGLEIVVKDEHTCTLGFNARLGGRGGFVTNSHCTLVPGDPYVEGTVFYQGGTSDADIAGTEEVDPPFFTGEGCYEGMRCRWSDSAFVRFATSSKRGFLARTALDSTQWNGTDYYRVVGEADPVLEKTVWKVGKTTGTTVGIVKYTCTDTPVGGTNIVLLCQARADFNVQDGDSGSPVFRIVNSPAVNDVILVGIVWGCDAVGEVCTGGGGPFSRIGVDGVQHSTELGPMDVCAVGFSCPNPPPSPTPTPSVTPTPSPTPTPPICTGCGPYDHYYVWRGGSDAINKAVFWAANSFIARFPSIKTVKFNSGGGASGFADNATVFIYANEAMTQKIGEVFVSNIADYGETVAEFPAPIAVNVGQQYWFQVHTGTPNTKILLYFSRFGTDYGGGCAYWNDGSVRKSCAIDQNGVVQTVQPTPTPPPSGDHYNVWRGGDDAINKAVWWAANSFAAAFPSIKRVYFNSGGGSSGWADSAYVKIFRNEAMTDLVGEVFVSNIVDYGSTLAEFPSALSVTVGQTYWWQVHSGVGTQKILLYFSKFGSDYPNGCAYWRDDITYKDCAFDLNGIVQSP